MNKEILLHASSPEIGAMIHCRISRQQNLGHSALTEIAAARGADVWVFRRRPAVSSRVAIVKQPRWCVNQKLNALLFRSFEEYREVSCGKGAYCGKQRRVCH